MSPAVAKRLRLLASVVSVLVLLLGAAALWFYFQLRASLPQLDGSQSIAGLAAPVTVTRDALGVPTVRAANRADIARALGYLHAQERYFQMDLLRRRSAGELAALFGPAALPLDRATRPHHFRELARTVLARLPAEHRALLEAYTAGVNAGRATLSEKPFEYLLLRSAPQPWLAEDSLLVVYSMYLDLQDADNRFERSLAVLRDQLGEEAVAFFCPLVGPDDAAVDGTTAPLPPLPGPGLLDLRQTPPLSTLNPRRSTSSSPAASFAFAPSAPDQHPGSNSFALAGHHTATGAALLANDPHLNLGVPNIWYRVALEWPATGDASHPSPLASHQLIGVTIPGLPFVVLGSNHHVAWGFTVAYADTADLVAVELNAVSDTLYKIPGRDDLVQIETRRDTIHVKGAPDEIVETQWTVWGPIVGHDAKKRPLSQHWIAHDPGAINFDFLDLESATTVAQAVDVAHRAGIPAHNFLVADDSGAIAWTIIGKVPNRVGFDGRLPVSWSFGDRRWDGFLPPERTPTLTSTSSAAWSRLWTANNRIVGGPALAAIGDAGFDSPQRASRIRDDLATLDHATPRDLAAIQLDDRATYLDRWQQLALAVLTPDALAAHPDRTEFRRLIENWQGRATVDSVSYRLVRGFRESTAQLAFTPIFAACTEAYPNFNWRNWNYEPALWSLLTEKPLHLLAPDYANWDALLLAAIDSVTRSLAEQHVPLDRATWGARNTAAIVHPFTRILPLGLGRWLAMPAEPLPGDSKIPRVQAPAFGASMRLVVSPGREAEGLFQMPGGQSGHPLSPYYRAGHETWVRGDAAPLLPGPTQHTLTLTP